MKHCPKCSQDKPLDAFYVRKNGRPSSWCKGCLYERNKARRTANPGVRKEQDRRYREKNCDKVQAYQAQWRAKNPGRNSQKTKEWYYANKPRVRELARASSQKVKDQVIQAYGGCICNCCGETEPLFLSIDHINNDGAAHRKALGGRYAGGGKKVYDWIVKSGFPDGFQVLCMNCNWGKHRNHGVCPHRVSEGSTTIPKGSTTKRSEARSPSNQLGEDIV